VRPSHRRAPAVLEKNDRSRVRESVARTATAEIVRTRPAAMAAGMVLTISAVAVLATLSRTRLLSFFSRTEGARRWLGRTLEVGGAALVLLFGVVLILGATAA
ncbi:MAG: hypothetical protein AAGF09_06515, partial [Pseudomonadota bacterium]